MSAIDLPPKEQTAVSQRNQAVEDRIRSVARTVVKEPDYFHLLSTGEKIAVAMVLDWPDLWKFYGTALEAVDRMGFDWLRAALQVQRDGWEGE